MVTKFRVDARNSLSKFQERRKFDFANVAWTAFASFSSYYMSSSFTSTNVKSKLRSTIREPLFNCWSGNVQREEIGGSRKKQAFEKKRRRPTKETMKKTKKFVVEVGDSVEEK